MGWNWNWENVLNDTIADMNLTIRTDQEDGVVEMINPDTGGIRF